MFVVANDYGKQGLTKIGNESTLNPQKYTQ